MVNTKNNDQFYLDYMFLGTSLIIFIESKSNGKFYLDYLLRVSSEARFNKVQSIRHSFQHSSRTKKIRPLHDPLTVNNMHGKSLDSTPRQHCTQLISSCSPALVGLQSQAFISACIFKQTAQQY